jgi:hypothetical protein
LRPERGSLWKRLRNMRGTSTTGNSRSPAGLPPFALRLPSQTKFGARLNFTTRGVLLHPRFRHFQSAHVITVNPCVRLPGPARAWGRFDGRAEARDPGGRGLADDVEQPARQWRGRADAAFPVSADRAMGRRTRLASIRPEPFDGVRALRVEQRRGGSTTFRRRSRIADNDRGSGNADQFERCRA